MRLPLAVLAASLIVAFFAPGLAARTFETNDSDLPPGCDAIAGDRSLTVHGGRNYSAEFPGTIFVFDERSWDLPACTRVTVTFVNEDDVRHQFMVHGTYPAGFTLIEVDGPGEDTGTFILPSERETMLVHCGLPQHQQKGMVGEILVDGGNGDLPGIPGISGFPPEDRTDYGGGTPEEQKGASALGAWWAALALVAVALLARERPRHALGRSV